MDRWLHSTIAGKILRARDTQGGRGPADLLVPPPSFAAVSNETAPSPVAPAEVEWGGWVVRCPLPGCAGAEYGDPEVPLFRCHSCWNALVDGRFLAVLYPSGFNAIERVLLALPDGRLRSWKPGTSFQAALLRTQVLLRLLRDNPAWFASQSGVHQVLSHEGLRRLGIAFGEASWVTPPVRATGDVVTAAIWNQDVKDNTRYLKGMDGAVTVENAVIIQTAAGNYLRLPSLTTAQRDALTPATGMTIWNSSKTVVEIYDGSAWREVPGVAVDAAAGDIIYRGASVWVRLAAGAQGAVFYMGASSVPAWLAAGTSGFVLRA